LCFIEKATFVGGFFVCFGLGALRAWGMAASSCWSTRNRQPPHPMHATLWVFVAVATSVSHGARMDFESRDLVSRKNLCAQ
jgi:hypothetical protein